MEHKLNTEEWICPICGHINSNTNETCGGTEMGDGRCGVHKPKLTK